MKWQEFLKKWRKKHPDVPYREALGMASEEYRKKKEKIKSPKKRESRRMNVNYVVMGSYDPEETIFPEYGGTTGKNYSPSELAAISSAWQDTDQWIAGEGDLDPGLKKPEAVVYDTMRGETVGIEAKKWLQPNNLAYLTGTYKGAMEKKKIFDNNPKHDPLDRLLIVFTVPKNFKKEDISKGKKALEKIGQKEKFPFKFVRVDSDILYFGATSPSLNIGGRASRRGGGRASRGGGRGGGGRASRGGGRGGGGRASRGRGRIGKSSYFRR